MKPFQHCKNSARKYGGVAEDYIPVHNFFDETKAHMPDVRHRTILHNSYGIWLAERLFGTTITNSEGKKVSVRDLGEDHVIEDLGFIPTLQDVLKDLPINDIVGARLRKRTKYDLQGNKVETKELEDD